MSSNFLWVCDRTPFTFLGLGSCPSGYGYGGEAGICIWERPPILNVSGCRTAPICQYILRRRSHFINSLISRATLFDFSRVILCLSRKGQRELTIASANPDKYASRFST